MFRNGSGPSRHGGQLFGGFGNDGWCEGTSRRLVGSGLGLLSVQHGQDTKSSGGRQQAAVGRIDSEEEYQECKNEEYIRVSKSRVSFRVFNTKSHDLNEPHPEWCWDKIILLTYIRPPVVAPAPLLLSSCRWKAGAFCICRFGGGRAALTKADSRNCRCSSGDILRPPRRLLFCKSSRAAAPSSMSAMTEAELGQDVENRSILSPDGNRSRITSRGMTDR
eukprot:scaffold11046_cov183-Amphora_coffeaeformis.AAC.6